MSAGDDNVFARWSRRKQAVRDSEAAPPDEAGVADPAPADADAEPVDCATAEPPAEEPAEPLPRLEDLTAESDLSAFLRQGVPKALKSAALRRMWSLDPGIRDYVGPAEYAWDFNQPGSMAGFGPLDAKDAVVDFLSKVGRGALTDAKEADAAPEASPPQQQPADLAADHEASVSTDDPADSASPDRGREAQPTPADLPARAAGGLEAAPGQAAPDDPAQSPRIARQRHGRAVPR